MCLSVESLESLLSFRPGVGSPAPYPTLHNVRFLASLTRILSPSTTG